MTMTVTPACVLSLFRRAHPAEPAYNGGSTPGHDFSMSNGVKSTVFGIILLLNGCWLPGYTWAQSQAARALEYPPSTAAPASPADLVNEARGDLMRLPPLNELIDLSRKLSPQQKFLAKAIEVEYERKKIHTWADFKPLSINADAFVGNQDIFSVNSDGVLQRPLASVQNRTNTQAAVTIRVLPANIWVNKANRRIAELEAERIALLADQTAQNTAGEIAYLHGQTEKSLDLMDLFAESTEVSKANAEMGQRLFEQGAMTLADYSAVATAAVEASAKFNNARGEFRLYYQMLMTKVYGRVP